MDQNWSLERKSFVSNPLDSLVSYKTLSQVVAFGHFIIQRVEFALIFVGEKKVLTVSTLSEGQVNR